MKAYATLGNSKGGGKTIGQKEEEGRWRIGGDRSAGCRVRGEGN